MIPHYYIDCGTYKEIIRNDKLLFRCPFCGEWFRALAYHTTQKHGISARRLREIMGLKSNYQLITPCIKERHRETALRDNMGEQLKQVGKSTRYKKGSEGHTLWSPQAMAQLKKK